MTTNVDPIYQYITFHLLLMFQLREMCYFLIILFIVVASFGVVRQSIHYQDEEPNWFQVRNMFFYPYFMIYGELFADEIDSKYAVYVQRLIIPLPSTGFLFCFLGRGNPVHIYIQMSCKRNLDEPILKKQ